jgi:hypothetical protein
VEELNRGITGCVLLASILENLTERHQPALGWCLQLLLQGVDIKSFAR